MSDVDELTLCGVEKELSPKFPFVVAVFIGLTAAATTFARADEKALMTCGV